MNKLKNLKNWEKGLLAVLGIVIIIAIGMGVGKLTSKSNNPQVTVEAFKNLIEKDYSISNFKEDITDINMNMEISEGVSKDELNTISKSIFNKAKEEGWIQKNIKLNIFTGKATDEFDFYTDELFGTISIDTEKETASIGEFVDIPAVNKANPENMVEGKNELVTNDNGKVVISLDMNVDNSEANVMSQSLAYTNIVRTLNKDVKTIELKINPNAEKSFETHTNFDKIIKSVDVIKLSE